MPKVGNIGVYTLEDHGTLYRVRFANKQPLIKIERLADGFTRWIDGQDFWTLLDKLGV
jgi:hypothetical protein